MSFPVRPDLQLHDPMASTSSRTLLGGVIALAALSSSWSGVKLGPLNLSDFFVLVALILIPFTDAFRRNASLLRAWMVLPAVVALVLTARDVIIFGRQLNMSEVNAEGLSSGQMLARIVLSTICVAIVCVVHIGGDERRGRRLLAWWVTGVVTSSAYALGQATGVFPSAPDGLFLAQINGFNRFAGFSSHPNALAQTIVLAVPIVLLSIGAKAKLRRLLATVVLVIALFGTGSRAGLLVGFIAVAVSALVLGRRKGVLRWTLPLVILAVAGAIVFGPRVIGGTRFAQSDGVTQSNSGRVQALGDGWELFSRYPITGAGLGSWVGELAPLVLLASGGLVLLAVYSTFAVSPLISLWRIRRQELAEALFISATMVLPLGLLNNGFTERYSFWPALIGAGVYGIEARRSAKRGRPTAAWRG